MNVLSFTKRKLFKHSCLYVIMVESTLRLFNPWWSREFQSPGIRRSAYLERIEYLFKLQKIVILYGLRRVGKSIILKQYISEKIKEFGRTNIFYASVDHPKINHLSLIDLLGEFRRINRAGNSERQLLILDEVHHRNNFEIELKALNDSETNLMILVAGSSSLIIRHRSPALTGRYMKLEIQPLDFAQYLEFKGMKYDVNDPDRMAGLLEDYLVDGGMPQYVLTSEPQMLLNIIEDVIYKDIVKEYSLRDPNRLNELFFLLMDRVGKPISYRKIGNLIDIKGDAATRYINFFCQTYMLDLCQKSGSPNERIFSHKKVYCADNGFRVVLTGTRGIGSLAENLVYNILRRKGDVFYHLKDGSEIDFILNDKAIEVKYKDEITEADLRNLRSLKNKRIKTKILITRKETNVGKDIINIPLWKFAQDPQL